MSAISTHVLDTVVGKPAAGISIRLDKRESDLWNAVSSGMTDEDGRCGDLAMDAKEGLYRLIFNVDNYLTRSGRTSIYPEITITFRCNGKEHYHLPLLLSDNSYTTYRGS